VADPAGRVATTTDTTTMIRNFLSTNSDVGLYAPLSSAAAAVTTLNVDPGG